MLRLTDQDGDFLLWGVYVSEDGLICTCYIFGVTYYLDGEPLDEVGVSGSLVMLQGPTSPPSYSRPGTVGEDETQVMVSTPLKTFSCAIEYKIRVDDYQIWYSLGFNNSDPRRNGAPIYGPSGTLVGISYCEIMGTIGYLIPFTDNIPCISLVLFPCIQVDGMFFQQMNQGLVCSRRTKYPPNYVHDPRVHSPALKTTLGELMHGDTVLRWQDGREERCPVVPQGSDTGTQVREGMLGWWLPKYAKKVEMEAKIIKFVHPTLCTSKW